MSDLGENGFRLLTGFELGPDGKPATTSYLCSGSKWTLGLGATEWPDGRAVKKGEFCTDSQAMDLTNYSLRKFAEVVDQYVTVEMTQNQRDAFLMLAYNVGPDLFKDSTAVHLHNVNALPIEIARAFGKFCKAHSVHPDKGDLSDANYTPIIGKNSKGDPCWYGPNGETVRPDGKPIAYFRAMPGILRRHLSEACCYLDFDWVQACRKDTVAIVSQRVWDEKAFQWEDRVRSKTELDDVLPIAREHPLDVLGETPGAAGEEVPAAQPELIPLTVSDAPRQTAPVSVEIASPSAEQGETPQINATPPSDSLQRVEPKPAPPSPPFLQDAPAKPYAEPVPQATMAGPAVVATPAGPVKVPAADTVTAPASQTTIKTPYGDVSVETKALELSKRAWAFVGIVVSRSGLHITWLGALAEGLTNPVYAVYVIPAVAVGTLLVVMHVSEWLKHHGQKHAKQALH